MWETSHVDNQKYRIQQNKTQQPPKNGPHSFD